MPTPRNSSILRTIPLLLIVLSFCSFACGRVIYVDNDGQADSVTIQAGIDAAEYGDTVSVAPGFYFENVVLKSGVDLIGAGAGATIIDAGGYGDVVDVRADDVVLSGFTLRNSGEFDLGHMNCGVYCRGDYSAVITDNVITGNRIGIGLWDEADLVVRNNVIENNFGGLYIYGTIEHPTNPTIVNNTIVNNQIDGITLRVMVSPSIINNIISGHTYGINHNYVTGSPVISYNNLWRNDVNYLLDNSSDDTLAGPGSLSVDPLFADSDNGDYHLKSEAGRWDPAVNDWVIDDVTSPCIDAGDTNSPVGPEPIPNSSRINMGACGGTAEASKLPSGLDDKYSGGTGEPNDPYLIYTAEHLNALGAEPNDYDKHFKLMADIDLSGYTYDRAVIAPDMNEPHHSFEGTSFNGVIDGNGHTISHMTITGESYLGLFGQIGSGAMISSLGLEAVDVNGTGDFVGGLAGHNREGSITTSYSTGTVTGEWSVGGLIGINLGSIDISYGTVVVTGRGMDVGGLVGRNGGSITTSYATGAVAGEWAVGGFVGDNSGSIADSYCTGTASGTGFGPVLYNGGVGGFVGSNSDGYVTASYSIGAVSGLSDVGSMGVAVGGLHGGGGDPMGEPGAIYRSFWDVETSDQTTSVGGTGLTTAEMQTAGTFLDAGWDFVDEAANGTSDIWWIIEGQDYPRLWWEIGN